MPNNMRVGVAALIFCENTLFANDIIIMGRRGKDPNRGKWVLPGGGVQEGETLEQALRREVLEETGLRISRVLEDYWSVIEIPGASRLVLITHAWTHDIEHKAGSDLEEVQWVNTYRLPKDTSPLLIPFLVDRMCYKLDS